MFFRRPVQFSFNLFLAATLLAGFLFFPASVQRAFAADRTRMAFDVVSLSDTTIASALNDGTVNVGEYIGFSSGINNGFGNVIGSNSRLYVDSGSNGALNFGLVAGAANAGNDAVVIYIDINGLATGYTTTNGFTDTGDNCRSAISGYNGTSRARLDFAPGFAADYAICMDAINIGYAGLWQLTNGGAHTHITTLNRTSVTINHYEMNLTLANLGLPSGGTFRYVATYLNASTAYRSDEFHGVSAFGPGNPGQTTVTLSEGDFNTFTSIDITPVVDRADDTNESAAQVCNDNLPNDCSLRGAISKANADPSGVYTITFDPNLNSTTLMLSIAGMNDNNNFTGDLDIRSNLTIQGNGARYTIINAHDLDRVFHVYGVYTVILNDLTVENGTINGISPNYGGGIYNENGTLTINNCTIQNNFSTNYGGGIENGGGNLTINNSTINNNRATIDGGGIENVDGALTIVNSTISGNIAVVNGGGLTNTSMDTDATVTLNQVTITANQAQSGDGGGINNDQGSSGNATVNINRSIVSGNDSYNAGEQLTIGAEINNMGSTGTINTVSNNVFGHDGWDNELAYYGFITPTAPNRNATSNGNFPIPLDEILATTLADNGGPTNTHALVTDSPALDRVACTGVDQRGAARNYNGACDSGSVERREIIAMGTCFTGAFLEGMQTFPFASGTRQVTINLTNGNNPRCISIEEMGPGANHLLATDGGAYGTLRTGNWWHITGDVTTGLGFDITLPYASANDSSRVCRWPGNLGGAGWDCGTDADNAPGLDNVSVTRTGLHSFSDWTIGSRVSPTAVKLNRLSAQGQTAIPYLPGLVALAAAGVGLLFWKRRKV